MSKPTVSVKGRKPKCTAERITDRVAFNGEAQDYMSWVECDGACEVHGCSSEECKCE